MRRSYLYVVIAAIAFVLVGIGIYWNISTSDERTTRDAIVEEISAQIDKLHDGPMAIMISKSGDIEKYIVTLEDGKVVVKDDDDDTTVYTFDVETFSK